MRQYQQRYVDNLATIANLSVVSAQLPENVTVFMEQRNENTKQINALIEENTDLLRRNLMPVIDDIISASEEEIQDLDDFADRLLQGSDQLDLFLNYIVRNALVTYARKWGKRDMLIKELYYTGLALFYMQDRLIGAGLHLYQWKMSLMFGEAAGYIKKYDEIEDAQTRGYIHRSMANLALSYPWKPEKEAVKKLDIIRYSMKILTDPVYRAKTPTLPWDTFVYKSHQERSSGTAYLKDAADGANPKIVGEILESTEYVWRMQLEADQKRGKAPSSRWILKYELTQYHCGIRSLSYLLTQIEKCYMERDPSDYSQSGIENNLYVPAIYAEYIALDERAKYKKKEILGYMYRMMVKYVKGMPGNQRDARMVRNLLMAVSRFIEYPGGISLKDFLLELVVCRNPDVYADSRMVAHISQKLMLQAVERAPHLLLGLLGCEDIGQVKERAPQLARFAYESGMLHDVGFISVSSLMVQTGRSWFEEEQKMYESHVYAGRNLLQECESTKPYVYTAFGHHRFYNEKGGYPEAYRRDENPNQVVTDMVSVAAFLVQEMDGSSYPFHKEAPGKELLASARLEAGSRLSPAVVGLLDGWEEELVEYLQNGKTEAYEEAFDLLRGNNGAYAILSDAASKPGN